jgi:hypothetical protein
MTTLIDYAYPMMMAENAMKEAHIHMLNKEYDHAIEQMLVAISEARMTLNSIKHMKEQEHAIRKHTPPV